MTIFQFSESKKNVGIWINNKKRNQKEVQIAECSTWKQKFCDMVNKTSDQQYS